ncbi:hypothetical protein PA08_0523 [Cutibacterium modestum P08]|nr:hypothetical protein PA08_0523 [Cutibacterium modestum P08]
MVGDLLRRDVSDKHQASTSTGQSPHGADNHGGMLGFLGISDVKDGLQLLGNCEGRHLFRRCSNEVMSLFRIGWDEDDGGRRQLNPPWSAWSQIHDPRYSNANVNHIPVRYVPDNGTIRSPELSTDSPINPSAQGIPCAVLERMMTTPSPKPLNSALVDHCGVFLELDRDWWPDELCIVSSAPTLCLDRDDSQARYEATKLTRAVHIIIVETMAGRRPMSQLVKASSTRAIATMRRWPRGPGWSRMLLVGEPRVSYDDNQVDGVGLLDLRGRRLPMATRLALEGCAWRLDAVELVLNPKVAMLLTSKKITCETVGLG